ncbi:dipeptidase [Longispora fulva]|uniref:Membrane dipeptidase n=1 Tax=Longispora fulva TaxID=619741 RepID=A0A8J7GK64_9ACTN|nr:dipeptidase [Longispora fulva]MBG6139120.1 membrane dipeptidase [Longispora fulva]GIG58612.1 dipeptidase [Longispora fulva]
MRIIDGHNDLAWQLRVRYGYDLDRCDLATDQTATGLQTDLPRLRAGGVAAQFWSVWVDQELPDPVTATLEQVDAVHDLVRRHGDLEFAATAADVERAWERGRVASLLGAEGGHQIDSSLGVLRMLHRLGVRYLTLTHIKNIPWADSATDEPVVGGLTDFGHDVVRELNRLRMMVDLSHVAPSTMHAALDTSNAPAFFSHSSARGLCDHPRNVPDDVLGRVRDTEGLVMVTFVPWFLTEECRAWADEKDKQEDAEAWLAANPLPPVGVSDVADHVEYVRDVAGVAHVGLGGDYDGVEALPSGLEDVAGYPRLLDELRRRRWSEADLAALAHGNALRVMRASL